MHPREYIAQQVKNGMEKAKAIKHLAAELSVSVAKVQQWLRGENRPSIEVLAHVKLMDRLGL